MKIGNFLIFGGGVITNTKLHAFHLFISWFAFKFEHIKPTIDYFLNFMFKRISARHDKPPLMWLLFSIIDIKISRVVIPKNS